jgi:pyrroloquinoline quinone biosynthesis protein D
MCSPASSRPALSCRRIGNEPAALERPTMKERIVIADGSMPKLVSHARLQFNKQRDQWLVQAPERVIMLDAIALEIVQRCDGAATVSAIVDDLAAKYAAPRELIAGDVGKLLQDLADKGVMTA